MKRTDRDPQSLQDVIERLDALVGYGKEGEARFHRDRMLRDAVLHCLMIAGEATKRLSDEFRAAHPDVPWKRIAGLRDIITHGYETLSMKEIWDIVKECPALLVSLKEIKRTNGW